MALAEFLCVCMDATDPQHLGRWWADVLGLEWTPHHEPPAAGEACGPKPCQRILFLDVPGPKTVKHRVHLDIYARSRADLEAAGASFVAALPEWRWTTMADPEGGEFCGFWRDDLPPDRLHGLVVDCADPGPIAEWWGAVYDAEVIHHADGYSTVQKIPGMPIETMDFVPVPEPKVAKNRIHWDVAGDADGLVAAGATVLRRPEEGDIGWTVLADPEGNEFCVFSPDS